MTVAAPAVDPRLQEGAYITDGRTLYLITGKASAPRVLAFGAKLVTLPVENCKTGWPVTLDVSGIERSCTLVKAAPSDDCPDAYDA